MDNEKSLNSIKFMLTDQLKMEIFTVLSYKSTVNGQIERFDPTLSEIMHVIKKDKIHRTFDELLERAIYEYNYTFHSVTNQRPLVQMFFRKTITTDPEQRKKSTR